MKWFEDIKIANKLIIGFLVIALFAGVVGGFGIVNLMHIRDAGTQLYEEDTLSLEYTGSAAVDFQQIRYNALKLVYLDTNAVSDINEVAGEMEETASTLDDLFTSCSNVIQSEELVGQLNDLEAEWKTYQSSLESLISYKKAGNEEQVLQQVSPLSTLGTSLRGHFLDFFAAVAGEAEARSASNIEEAHSSIVVMVVVLVVAILLSLFLGIYISNLIGKPLVLLQTGAEHLAIGDIEMDGLMSDENMQMKKRKDEVGKLATAFYHLIRSTKEQVDAAMTVADGDLTAEIAVRSEKDLLGKGLSALLENLNHLVSSIMAAAEQISAGANLVSDSSVSLSQGATEQASSVQELTASLEEISSQTTLNADNAEKASELARHTKANADQGNTQMKEMLRAMDEINQSSTNISKIIKVIDDIAFQTNILALNAAVEAARAGQHGKGFAVVAEEVRTLAARSANAAKETTDMIEGSIRKVETGTKIANDTAKALEVIVQEIDKAAELIGSIAVASKEQSLGIEQINQGIMQVSQVVQTNAATSEESAAASEELASQAARLKETVNVFKIKKAGMMAGTAPLGPQSKSPAAPEETDSLEDAPIADSAPKKPVISLSDQEFGKY